MGDVDLNRISFVLPDGRPLLDEVSFRVSDGAVVALVGPNGTGKTTLLRIIAGDLDAHDGAVTRSGGLGVMRQFIGSVRDETTVRDLLLSVAPAPIAQAARAVDEAELRILEVDDEPAQLRDRRAGMGREPGPAEAVISTWGVSPELRRWRPPLRVLLCMPDSHIEDPKDRD